MSRASASVPAGHGGLRTAATAAVAGGVGMTVAAAAVLTAQALETRRRIGPRRTVPPYHDGRYGHGHGTSIRLAMLGDSGAAGLGADFPGDTIGAIVATGVAAATGRPVVFTNHAVVGAKTRDLDPQVERALTAPPHVAIIMVGANDVTHVVPQTWSQRELESAVRRLTEHRVQVVVGTCPDLGTVKPMPQPLRAVARRRSRTLAERQAVAAVQGGGRAVSLGSLLGPEFDARPEVMFAADRFHPSSEGYAAVADALLPSVMAALRLGPQGDLLPERWSAPEAEPAAGGEPLRRAAARAALEPGLDVSAVGHRVGGALAHARRLARLPRLRSEGPVDPDQVPDPA